MEFLKHCPWQQVPIDQWDLTELELSYLGRLDFLESRIRHLVSNIISLSSHDQTLEVPLHTQRKPSLEHWLVRDSSRLLICIGESFTWSDRLYGLATAHDQGPKYHPLIQNLFTIQGRLASYYNSSLRSVTVPGNANCLMLACLERVMEEVNTVNAWSSIVILQQFTDRARCMNTRGHPSVPWYNQWFENNKHINVFSQQRWVMEEQFLLNRLEHVIGRFCHLPIKVVVWRNFTPWLVKPQMSDSRTRFVDLSLYEFSRFLQGQSQPRYPISSNSFYYYNQIVDNFSGVDQQVYDYMVEQIEAAEIEHEWARANRFGTHPSAEMTQLSTQSRS
jgi:hypothetical protein